MKIYGYFLGLIVLLSICSVADADSLTLRDGHHVQGKFVSGTQGVIAFSVAGATQYYEVANILVMTFEGEGSDSQANPNQQIPTIPDSGSLQRQKSEHKTDNPKARQAAEKHPQKQKRPVRLILTAQRSE
jgi:hypothetical protein